MDNYVQSLFNDFVAPGLYGGLLLGFSVYLLSLGFAKAFELVNNFGSYDVYED